MAFKIYTKKGDTGETGLYGGQRLPKDHIRIDAYGTVDELNAYVGLLRDHLPDPSFYPALLDIQKTLFNIGSHLAAMPKMQAKLPAISEGDIRRLELDIDAMEAVLPPLTVFILPGGHPLVSLAHVARTVCRRAERQVVALHRQEPVDAVLIRYLNRLSDYFFVLARHLAHRLRVEEIQWMPSGSQ